MKTQHTQYSARDRHLSGTAYASFGKNQRDEAQALCDAHNAEIARTPEEIK
jgi:hypothetical protein